MESVCPKSDGRIDYYRHANREYITIDLGSIWQSSQAI